MWTASIADKADRPRGRLNRSISTDVVLHLRELPNNALITGSNSPTADPRGAPTQCDCSSRIPPFTHRVRCSTRSDSGFTKSSASNQRITICAATLRPGTRSKRIGAHEDSNRSGTGEWLGHEANAAVRLVVGSPVRTHRGECAISQGQDPGARNVDGHSLPGDLLPKYSGGFRVYLAGHEFAPCSGHPVEVGESDSQRRCLAQPTSLRVPPSGYAADA